MIFICQTRRFVTCHVYNEENLQQLVKNRTNKKRLFNGTKVIQIQTLTRGASWPWIPCITKKKKKGEIQPTTVRSTGSNCVANSRTESSLIASPTKLLKHHSPTSKPKPTEQLIRDIEQDTGVENPLTQQTEFGVWTPVLEHRTRHRPPYHQKVVSVPSKSKHPILIIYQSQKQNFQQLPKTKHKETPPSKFQCLQTTEKLNPFQYPQKAQQLNDYHSIYRNWKTPTI